MWATSSSKDISSKAMKAEPGLSLELEYLKGLTVLETARHWVDTGTCVSVPRSSSVLRSVGDIDGAKPKFRSFYSVPYSVGI